MVGGVWFDAAIRMGFSYGGCRTVTLSGGCVMSIWMMM